MKKSLSLILLTLILLTSNVTSFANTEVWGVDDTNGTVSIQWTEQITSKLLLLVEKDGKRYTYPVVDSDINQFPLQMGNGTYTVRLMENITGTKYKELTRTTASIDLEEDRNVYLNSIQDIEWNENQAAIKKAKELTVGLKSDEAKVKAIYNYITKNFVYDYQKAKTVTSGYFPSVDSTFTNKSGICYDYSSLFAAMLRSVNVPTKLVKGYSSVTKDIYHAWNEVYVNGEWKVIDTTVDAPSVQSERATVMYKAPSTYKAERFY